MVNNPLIRPAISWGGGIGGVHLDSHDIGWDVQGWDVSETPNPVGLTKRQPMWINVGTMLLRCLFVLGMSGQP